jgi:lysozyme
MRMKRLLLSYGALCVGFVLAATPARAAREEGVDVSEWQFDVDWPMVKASGRTFAFIRATRGGLTGTISSGEGRYDDPRFIENVTEAKAAGMLVAPYHFARADILTHAPETEAQHFIDVAGSYMVPGYLRPVLDLEAGGTEREADDLADWALRFCNYVAGAKGEIARPIIYTTRNFVNVELDGSQAVGGHKLAEHPLWLAAPQAVHTETGVPVDPQNDPTPPGFYLGTKPIYPNPLGLWGPDTGSTPNTWAFWQYTQAAPAGTVPGIDAPIDLDVFHSELGSMSMFLVPEPASLSVLALAGMALVGRRQLRRTTND